MFVGEYHRPLVGTRCDVDINDEVGEIQRRAAGAADRQAGVFVGEHEQVIRILCLVRVERAAAAERGEEAPTKGFPREPAAAPLSPCVEAPLPN